MAKTWQQQLEAFAVSLESSLGEKLVSLQLYGSAARDARAGGDVNVLLIVRDATAEGLAPAADAIGAWVRQGHVPPIIMDHDEWLGSTDVFPIEVEDMREAHRVIRGADPFTGVTTARADLRAELEREARSKLLHLRTGYAAAARNGKQLEHLLERSSGAILTLMRAALRLAGGPVPAGAREQVAAAAALVGFEPAAFDWVLDRRAGATVPRLSAFDVRAHRYLDAVQKLAAWANTQ